MKMKKTAAKTTTTPTDQLRERCQGHFLTLRIPVESAALEELLARAEKESLSHLHFLDLLLGAQADARRERAVERRIRDAHFEETKLWKASTGSSIPRPSIACRSKSWPRAT